MNKITLTLTCLLLCNLSALYGQRTLIKANLGGIIQKNYGGSLEFVLSEKLSLLAGAAYTNRTTGSSIDSIGKITEKGFMAIPELRFYLNSEEGAPKGLFVSTNIIYNKINISVINLPLDTTTLINTSGEASNLGIGFALGSQWIFAQRFAIELFFNPYYNIPSLSGEILNYPSYIYEEKRGFQFNRIGISVGLAF